MLIARLLSVDEYGKASTYMLVIALIELVSDMALEKSLVQAKKGGQKEFIHTAHTLQIIRSVCLALILFFTAPLLAMWLKQPAMASEFQILALIPIIRGFVNYDMIVQQRDYKYFAMVLSNIVPPLITLGVVVVLRHEFTDHTMLLWVLIAEFSLMTAISHIIAKKTYGLAWDKVSVEYILKFGWPLLLNGILLFLAMHGDRFVVGRYYSIAELGIFSIAVLTTLLPALNLAKINNSFMLPFLSNSIENKEIFYKKYYQGLKCLALLACVMGILFTGFGPWIIVLVYGEKYSGCASFLSLIALAQAFRLMRSSPNTLAMSLKDTKIIFISSLWRASCFFMVLGVCYAGASLLWVPMIAAIGEFLAFTISIFLLQRRHVLRFLTCMRMIILPFSVLLILVFWRQLYPGNLFWIRMCSALAMLAFIFYVLLETKNLLRVEGSKA